MKNTKILLLEDSLTFGLMLSERLEKELHFKTIWAKTYTEAKQLLTTEKNFFIAITDLHLPDADMTEILDLTIGNDIPTVPITGDFSDDMQEFIWTKKVIDYVIKEGPFSVDYLISLAKRIYHNQSTKILIVDDSLTARTHLKSLLSYHNYMILEATNGPDALKILDIHEDIKLVLTDYKMPDMDGFELIKEIRSKYQMDRLSIIGLSAEGNHRISTKFIKYGANDFISKPFISEHLFSRVTQNIKIIEQFNTIKSMSYTDYLTGLYNRRHFFELAPLFFKNAKRNNSNIAIAMIDIDHFKKVNDTYGHHAGDCCITHTASIVASFFRESDITARFGGEEFCVLANNMDNEHCHMVFEKLRTKIEKSPVIVNDDEIYFTVSIGVCTTLLEDIDKMIEDADNKLYKAKTSGRNRVIIE